jgi:hypothetical protein
MKANHTLKYLVRVHFCALILISSINQTRAQAPLTIDTSGNVGIGTVQPKTKLHIGGDLGVNGILDLGINQPGREANAGKIGYGTFDTGSLCIVGAGNDGSSRRVTIWAEGGTQIRGNVSINKDTPPSAALDVNGRIKDQTGYVVPVGGIIMYTGNSGDLFDASGLGKPNTAVQGWALCNGNNNTPNLIDRFIVGSGPGSRYGANTGATGGAVSHSITTDEMPPHTHNYVKAVWGGGDVGASNGGSWGNNGSTVATSSTGGGAPMSLLPPYYSLFYIMKL